MWRETSFIVAKTRVAPLQSQTIPRLELLSALLLARLITTTAESLKPVLALVNPPRCFTDSMVTLFWIKGLTKEWKPFIQNRVNEIRGLVPPENWNHCPGETNPADLPSRGLPPLELSVNQLWHSGPEWLIHKANVNDQNQDETLVMPEECAAELKKTKKTSTHTLLTLECPGNSCELFKGEDYSSMPRLRRVTAYVLRAVKAFQVPRCSHCTQ